MVADLCLVVVHAVSSSRQRSPRLPIHVPDETNYAGPKAWKVVDVNVVPVHGGRGIYADHCADTLSMRLTSASTANAGGLGAGRALVHTLTDRV